MDELIELHEILIKHFNEEPLKTLSFKLKIPYDDLPALGREGKARELVVYCHQHGRLPELVQEIKKQRPRIVLSDALMAYVPDGKTVVNEIPPATPLPQKIELSDRKQSEDVEPPKNPVGSFAEKKIRKISIAAGISLLGIIAIVLFSTILFSLPSLIQNLVASTREVEATPRPTVDPFIPPPNPTSGSRWIRLLDNMIMVYVPPDTFPMGSNLAIGLDTEADELPQHEVTLDGFWIDRTEVTNDQYALCVQAGSCDVSQNANDSSYNGESQPVVGVSWFGAKDYCAWAGGQLPTEAQWEYAARGNDSRLYPWGNEIPTCELAQFVSCNSVPVPVGSFSPAGDSWVGTADMAGNVWEWVADWYSSDYYDNSPNANPTGPGVGDFKVLRGGSWGSLAGDLQSAIRFSGRPIIRDDYIGFRCSAPGQ